MKRRALAALVVAMVLAGCSGGSKGAAPPDLPPTTMTSTPVDPPGVADTVRRWVATLSESGHDDAAFAVLAPRSQAAVGGRQGYTTVAARFTKDWGVWAKTPGVAYDAVPVGDGLALVIIHAPDKDGGAETGAAVMMRSIGGEWRPDPSDTTGSVTLQPSDRTKIKADDGLSVDVERGVNVTPFVDGHVADLGARTTAGTVDHVVYRPDRPLAPGWHLVALGFVRGDAVSATVIRYEVPASK